MPEVKIPVDLILSKLAEDADVTLKVVDLMGFRQKRRKVKNR